MISDLLELFNNENRHERNRHKRNVKIQSNIFEECAVNKSQKWNVNTHKKSASTMDLSSFLKSNKSHNSISMAQRQTNVNTVNKISAKNTARKFENFDKQSNRDATMDQSSMFDGHETGNFKLVQKEFEKLSHAPERSEGCGKSNMKYLTNKFETQANGKDHVLTTCYRKDSGSQSSSNYLYVIKRPKKEQEQSFSNVGKIHVSKIKLDSDRLSKSDLKENSTTTEDICEEKILSSSPEEDFLENDGITNVDIYEKNFDDVISLRNSDDGSRNLNIRSNGLLDNNISVDSNKVIYERSLSENNCLSGDAPSLSTQRNSQIVKLHKIKIKTVATNLLTPTEIQEPIVNDKILDIINEMVETEKAYVQSLKCIVEQYMPEMTRNDIPPGLRGQKFQVFGNIEKIYAFHNNSFLVDLKKCAFNPDDIGDCFLKYENMFNLYSLYNKNKPKSDEYMIEYGIFFEDKQKALGESLNLSSQLLKPVQRLARYSLLLKNILKINTLNAKREKSVQKAYDMIIYQLRHGDDLLLLDTIKNCSANLNEQGKLLRQEEFFIMQCDEKKSKKIRVFLFEELIVFCIPSKTNPDELNYLYSIKMSEVGLTDYEDPVKFYIWYHKYYNKKYVFEALCPNVKSNWVRDISYILRKQADTYKTLKKAELTQQGLYSETRIPIKELESDEDERTSNKQYLTTRSLHGVPGERRNRIAKTVWYCKNRSSTGCLMCREENCTKKYQNLKNTKKKK